MKRWPAFVAASLVLVVTSVAVTPAGAQDDPGPLTEPASEPAEVVVRFEDDAVRASSLNGQEVETTGTPGSRYATVDVPEGEDPEAVAAELEARGDISVAEPNRRVRAYEAPGQVDEFERIGVQHAWTRADGASDVTVAVIDSGIDADHPDFAGGRIVEGKDWIDEGSYPHDTVGHGTQVAGVIAASHDGGTAIDGVAGGGTRIMPLRVLDGDGGFIADVADAIEYAANRGVDVINLSLGMEGTSTLLDNAASYARDRNVVVVAAAGNWDKAEKQENATVTTPAGAPGVIGVGATNDDGELMQFSIWGPMVDLTAPGYNIDTTCDHPTDSSCGTDQMNTATGTSFAAPMVAGVAALLRDRHPDWTSRRIEDHLLRTSEDLGPAGIDYYYGLGLVDAAVALGAEDYRSGGTFASPTINGTYDPVVGDFFPGDGITDILYYAPGGANDYLHLGAPSGFRNVGELPVNATYEPFTVDLDGNRQDDIVWYAPGSASDFIWYWHRTGYQSVPTKASGDYEPFTLDLNGDTFEDIVWYAPGPAQDYIWYGQPGGGHRSVATKASGRYQPFTGDFNGDGFDDIFWYAPGTAQDFIWYGTIDGHTSVATTVNGHYRPIAGDFDANGYGDVLWYAPGSAADFQWLFRPGGYTSVATTINGTYRPLGGDFNGDRYDDVLFYGVGTRADYMRFGSSNGLR
ncbi:MAG: S8 family serine peptidase [Acidimicrobiales bacterium]|nr:S8 family serine peptidase [Acidimicrobiales bacterium]